MTTFLSITFLFSSLIFGTSGSCYIEVNVSYCIYNGPQTIHVLIYIYIYIRGGREGGRGQLTGFQSAMSSSTSFSVSSGERDLFFFMNNKYIMKAIKIVSILEGGTQLLRAIQCQNTEMDSVHIPHTTCHGCCCTKDVHQVAYAIGASLNELTTSMSKSAC